MDHVYKLDLGGEGETVVDDGLPAWSIPDVQFDTAATGQENLPIPDTCRTHT